MYLISSAITKAFHGYGGQYARYSRQGDSVKGGNNVMDLTPEKQGVLIDALLERWEHLTGKVDATEQMLRSLTGSITRYMDTVGAEPMTISPFDRAVLAIRDGELEAFKELYAAAADHADELLLEAAGRPGYAGRKMTEFLLASVEHFEGETYLAASRRAVDTCDGKRVQFLMEQAQRHVEELDPAYYGEVIYHAFTEKNQDMATQLVMDGSEAWTGSLPSYLLSIAVTWKAWGFAETLVSKGVSPGYEIVSILEQIIRSRHTWVIEVLFRNGMAIPKTCYPALRTCIKLKCAEAGEVLIDYGFDIDAYCDWARQFGKPDDAEQQLIEKLRQYAEEKKAKEIADGKTD